MVTETQKEKARQFRQMHATGAPILVLGNAWDAASACILEQVGFRAIGTTSSGVAAVLGYRDGEQISRAMLLEVVERMARVINCPLSADIEAGFGGTLDEVLSTVRAVIEAGAVGINIEESVGRAPVDVAAHVERLKAIRELARSMDIELVINSWIGLFLRPDGDPSSHIKEAVARAQAYFEAGADCVFPIGLRDTNVIERLAREISGPINVIAGPAMPAIPELERLGVARVSLASGAMRAVLAHLRAIGRELLESGTYGTMEGMLSVGEMNGLF